MVKEFMLSTGKLSLGGLPRNSEVRITDCPGMTLAVYHECKASNQQNKGAVARNKIFYPIGISTSS